MAIRHFAALSVALAGIALLSGITHSQPPVVPAGGATPAAGPVRSVCYIYGNVPITREELGDYLIARGGYEKLDKLVNRRIIEIECTKKGITVTPQEMEALLNEDMKGLSMDRTQFLSQLLPKYQMSYYEWMEDVIRPRLQLKKLCQNEVKVSDEDIQKQFDMVYGEKRRCQIIIWPRDQQRFVTEQFDMARKNQEEFDRIARAQANPSLAATAGHVLPICRHQAREERIVEDLAFKLKPGEVSQVFETSQGYMIMKLHEILPADSSVTLAQKREELSKIAFEKKVEELIPTFFAKLREAAKPSEPTIGPPAEWRLSNIPRDQVEKSLKKTPLLPAEKK